MSSKFKGVCIFFKCVFIIWLTPAYNTMDNFASTGNSLPRQLLSPLSLTRQSQNAEKPFFHTGTLGKQASGF